jgi:hypothetical protein
LVSKKDRDREDVGRGRRDCNREGNDFDRRPDCQRDESWREREELRRDNSRRDRDPEREFELDDPRRWRDDGKRDERLAAKRDRERARDIAFHETGNDTSRDRRCVIVEERDFRSKRSIGRDKRTGGVTEDGKGRDNRKDREREKEKEKEPAWMETYVPTDPSQGILGGKSMDVGVGGMQGRNEKEQENNEVGTIRPDNISPPEEQELDEIQLFRLMMKREEKKATKAFENIILDDMSPQLSTLYPTIARSASGGALSLLLSDFLHVDHSRCIIGPPNLRSFASSQPKRRGG